MQISSDPSANQAPSSRGPSVQWIGVQWRGGHYALKLSSLAAVFKTSSSVQTDVPSELDLEVHDGAPVFMRSFAHCFCAGFRRRLEKRPGLGDYRGPQFLDVVIADRCTCGLLDF